MFYRFFGREAGTAPVVLVNHSLTGDAEVTGEKGWWRELVGPEKCIDTNKFTILAINVPGNGADGKQELLLQNYTEFTLDDVAKIFSSCFRRIKNR